MRTYTHSETDRNQHRAVTVPRETIAHLIDDLVGLLLIEEAEDEKEAFND
ncbi:hypothetical protein [Sphingomicrobium marinum]|nr:hypothetical protein [Sphingomicrobium marinum]